MPGPIETGAGAGTHPPRLREGLNQLGLHARVQFGDYFWPVSVGLWAAATWGLGRQMPDLFADEELRTHTLTLIMEYAGALWAAMVVARAPVVQQDRRTREWLATLPKAPAALFAERGLVSTAAAVLGPLVALVLVRLWAGPYDLAAVVGDGLPPVLFIAGMALLAGGLAGWPASLALAGGWWLLSLLQGPAVGGNLFLFAYAEPHEGLVLEENRRLLTLAGLAMAGAGLASFSQFWWRSRLVLQAGAGLKRLRGGAHGRSSR